MYLTVKQQVKKLTKLEFQTIKLLSHIAKNLYNQGVYNVRQHYFEHGTYLNYEANYKALKDSPNYKLLNSNMAQQILKEVDGCFQSFFGLLRKAKVGNYSYQNIRLPGYMPKDGFMTLVIGFVRIKDNVLKLPYSRLFAESYPRISIKMPPNLRDANIKEIRIKPISNARYFEIQYTYEVEEVESNLNKNNALAIDLGINNLATCVSSLGGSFIIDGRRLKSFNQWYNKENARLQSIKDILKQGSKPTKRQSKLTRKRNNKVNDYMSKAARLIINYCLHNDIGQLVLGFNDDFQRSSNLGRKGNQNFVQIPYGKLRHKLDYLCKLYGIEITLQEESYTSRASFFDRDHVPSILEKEEKIIQFSGSRVSRGMYKQSCGKLINADINGALNILAKSKVVSLAGLYSSGEVDTPIRLRVA